MSRMPHASTLVTMAVPLLVVLAAPRPASSWPSDPSSGVPICTATGTQRQPVSTADGAGGVILAWPDQRNGNWDIYAMRLTSAGQLAPGWSANGVPVCTAIGEQSAPAIVSDGADGAIIAWQDYRSGNWDIYAQHLTGAGAVAPGWPADGMVMGAATPASGPRDENYPAVASDGSGGAFVAWTLVYTPGSDNDIYGNHVTGAGTIVPGWSATGSALDGSGLRQEAPTICPDGAGGVFVVYQDATGGDFDVHAQRWSAGRALLANQVFAVLGDQTLCLARSDGAGGFFVAFTYEAGTGREVRLLHANGALEALPNWAWGVLLATSNHMVEARDIVNDGSGGAYVSWMDHSMASPRTIALQHILADANRSAGWPDAGLIPPQNFSFSDQPMGSLVPDGAGGVIVTYEGFGGYFGHIGAIRYLSNGTVANGWPATGALVCNGPGGQTTPVAVSDGKGGALVAWTDYRNTSANTDIYANRVEHFGRIGSPEPALAGVKDVEYDQGGHVRVSWLPSYLDADPTYGIYAYYLFRQVPAAAAQAAVRRGSARLMSAAEFADTSATVTRGVPRYLVTRESAQTYYWEQVGSVSANELPGYSLTAVTMGDSTASGNPYTLFMVDAIGSGSGYWFSAPDSGYSVDDLAPAMPAPFTGTYILGSGAFLNWGPNAEPDLAGYRLYRGDSPGFVPGPSNLVVAQATTGYTDAGAAPAVYKLSAVDVHGNESPFTRLVPAGVADAPGAQVPREVFLARIEPNPARGGTTLRFGLPREGAAELALFDTQGRRVRALAAGTRAAGEHTVRWDGLDDGGHAVGSGVYFVRLSAEGRVFTRRLVRVE